MGRTLQFGQIVLLVFQLSVDLFYFVDVVVVAITWRYGSSQIYYDDLVFNRFELDVLGGVSVLTGLVATPLGALDFVGSILATAFGVRFLLYRASAFWLHGFLVLLRLILLLRAFEE